MRYLTYMFVTFLGCSPLVGESWNVKGTISAIDGEENRITIGHSGIKGLDFEAGNLEVNVSSGDRVIAEVGRSIKGQLTKEGDDYFLEFIWPNDSDDLKTMALINRDLTRPRIGQPKNKLLKIGDELPRFAMYNQMAQLITPDDWKGKLVVLNFIFTRSRVPTMSPATTRRLADIQARLSSEGHGDSVVFLSLSLDSEYDTPGVSYEFLDEIGVDHSSFWLLSGSKTALEFIRKKIGVVASPSEKTIINHSMVTLIADREGKIFYRKPGSRWDVEDIYGRLEILLTSR